MASRSFERTYREIHGEAPQVMETEEVSAPRRTYRVAGRRPNGDPLPGWPMWLRVIVFGPLVLALVGFLALIAFVLILGTWFLIGAIFGVVAGWVAAIFMALVYVGALCTVFIKRPNQ